MINLTRDPYHKLAGSIYCQNISKLDIRVGGQKVDSQFVINVYRDVFEGNQRVEMFMLDNNGKISESDGEPVKYSIYGDITVSGNPKHCGCWRGKRINKWWHRLNEGRPGW